MFMESTEVQERRRPGARKDPEADRLILETAHRLLRELGYDRLTMDAVAREAGVARTTAYRRYRDKADLVSAAIETLRAPDLPHWGNTALNKPVVAPHLGAVAVGRGSCDPL